MAFVIRTKKDLTYTLDYKGSKITCRPLTNKEYNALRKSHTTVKQTRTGPEEKTDVDKLLIDKFDQVVLGWDFVDEDKNPVPCDSDTKAEFLNLNTLDAMEILGQIDLLCVEDAVADQKN